MSYSHKNLSLALTACSLLILATSWAAANPIYVSTTGNDGSGDGSIGRPYRTIAKGFSSLLGGGTLYLRGGIYEEPGIRITEAINGPSNGQRTRISSYPGERAVFRPTSHTVHGIHTTPATDGPRNVTFDGWTIDFRLKNLELQRDERDRVVSIANVRFLFATNVTFTNMHFLNNTNGSLTQIYPRHASPYRGPGGNILVTSCVFSNVHAIQMGSIAVTPKHPIYWNTLRDVTIENSVFINGAPHRQAQGISVWDGDRAVNWVIRNNYIEGFVDGMYLHVHDSRVYNNIIVNCDQGHGLGQGSQHTLYANNTIFNTVRGHYGINAEGWGDTFVNNIVWGNWATGMRTGGTRIDRPSYWTNNIAPSIAFDMGAPTTSGNLVGTQYDPRFLNPPRDLGLGLNSAAAGKGVNLGNVFAYDQLGRSRPSTGSWDLGALLSGSSTQTSQPPKAPQGFAESR